MNPSKLAVLVCIGAAAVAQAGEADVASGSSNSSHLLILYTGDLFGYPRVPNFQRLKRVDEKPRYRRVKESGRKSPAAEHLLELLCPSGGKEEDSNSGDEEGKEDCSPAGHLLELLCRGTPKGEDCPAAELLRKGEEAITLRLGMGDNFAMDYFSRVVVVETEEGTDRYIPKDELYFQKGKGWWDVEDKIEDQRKSIRLEKMSGLTAVEFDNVADFFIEARYDALVPGKHDFYYGPERLRQIARYLGDASLHISERKGSQPVRMLGANLVIRSQEAKPKPVKAEFLRKKSRDYFTEDLISLKTKPIHQMKWAFPKTALPWIRRFRLRNAYPKENREEFEAKLCRLEGNRDRLPTLPDATDLPCPTMREIAREKEDVIFVPRGDKPLISDATYAVCVKRKEKEAERHYCQPFDVLSPFFQYPELAKPAGRAVQDIKPYLVKKDAKAVVFGVVEMGLEKKVGLLNSAWKNDDEGLDTEMATIDPVEAVAQAVDYCRDKGDCDGDTRYVLMAHMPRAAAQSLAKRLSELKRPMTVVLSQADAVFATAPEEVTYKAGHPTVTLTPYEPFAKPNGERKPLEVHTALLTPTGKLHDLTTKSISLSEELDGKVNEFWQWKADMERWHFASFRRRLNKAWCTLKEKVKRRIPDTSAPPLLERFLTITLHGMRESSRADVAIMQDRDFYSDFLNLLEKRKDADCQKPEGQDCEKLESLDCNKLKDLDCKQAAAPLPPGSCLIRLEDFDCNQLESLDCEQLEKAYLEMMEAIIEQILWKGDFVFTRTLKGSAIKAALKESSQLEKIEQDIYSIESEKGRTLSQIGLVRDSATKKWYINGVPLEDNSLYSVAMTDFLAFGDTGYPQLRSPAAPPAKRVSEIDDLPRLSDLVLHQICSLSGGCKFEPEKTLYDYYVDHSYQPALDSGPRANRWHQALNAFHEGTGTVPRITRMNGYREGIGQERPYWRLFVDKFEVSLSEYNHTRDTQDQVKQDFLGVTEEAVNQRENRGYGMASQIELRREHKRHHFFVRFEEAFFNERTLDDDEPRFIENYKENSLSIEAGMRKPFRGSIRRRAWLGWVASLNATSQFRSPLERFTLKVNCPNCEEEKQSQTTEIEVRIPKTSRFVGKGGLRLEGRQSWLELGMLAGTVLRPTSYSIVGDGVGETDVLCQLGGLGEDGKKQSISDCLNVNFPVSVMDPSRLETVLSGLSVQTESSTSRELGLFLNFNMRWDFPKGWGVKQLVLENRGRFFFNEEATDKAVDARYMNSLSVGPTVPIFRSLSLKPTYSILAYKNKVEGNTITGRGFEVKLEYRFDWKSGSEPAQVFRYGRPK